MYRQALCGFLRIVVTNVLVKASILELNLNETDAASAIFSANYLDEIYNKHISLSMDLIFTLVGTSLVNVRCT